MKIVGDHNVTTNLEDIQMSNNEAYEKKMEAQIEEWEAELSKLKAQSKQKSADAEIEYNKRMKELEAKKEEANDKLADIKSAGSESWEDMKDGMQDIANDFGNTLDDIKANFK